MKYSVIENLGKTYIKEVTLSSSNNSVRLDETLDLTARFSVVGGIKDAFRMETWEKAWNAWDKIFRMTYHVGVKRIVAGPVAKNLIRPQKFVRRASFYWTRNPDINPDYSKKVWCMVVLEGREPVIPKNEEEVKLNMFDIEKTFHLLGSDLGRGKHKLKAVAKASWGRHIFTEKGSSQKFSDHIEITCT